MKRRNILKELLTIVFGSTTVKISGGKIYKSGDLFSTCDFSFDFFEEYKNLFKIAFLKDKPEIQKPNYPPEDFRRVESIEKLFNYLKLYRSDLYFPNSTDPRANEIAYNAARSILSAIFSKSDNTDKFAIENEDICLEFREELNQMKNYLCKYAVIAFSNAINAASTPNYFYDTDYSDDKSQYNYSLSVSDDYNKPNGLIIITPILLKIYIDLSKSYDKNSRFFLNTLTSVFDHFGENVKQNSSFDEFYLQKPLSLTTIKHLPSEFKYVTHLDDATILNKYMYTNEYNLKDLVTEKAIKQYIDHIVPLIVEYEKSLVAYIEDLIKRILSLDLKWLYNDSEKKIEKCREEVEKILIGYPEVYSYIDGCTEDIIRRQLLAILHRAIILATSFVNENGQFIAKSAIKHNCERHIKYIKGKIYGNSFKELIALSEQLKETPTEAPKSLYECYYYTSSNELADLLNSISKYKNLFKKSKNSS